MRHLLLIITGLYSFPLLLACDEWQDKETGRIYRSGNPAECDYHHKKETLSFSKKEVLKLPEYIQQRKHYLNKSFKVEGKVRHPPSCPKCLPKTVCKPCFNQYFVFESVDKKIKVPINLKPNSKFLKNVKNNQKVVLSIKYLTNINGSTISSLYGHFILENDKIHINPSQKGRTFLNQIRKFIRDHL